MAASSARSHLTAMTCEGAMPLQLRPNTFAPLACRPTAMAAPMPREAPVTTAVLPSSEKAAGLCIAVAAHDGCTKPDVFRAIDLEHLVPLHQVHSDPAAEPVVLFAQQRGNENIERAVLQIALFDLLPHPPIAEIVVDRLRPIGADAPVEIVLDLADREQAVEFLVLERRERLFDVAGFPDRRRCLQRDDPPERAKPAIELLQRVKPRRFRRRQIAGDVFRTADADRAGGLDDGPGDQRLAAKIDQVLVRDTLGAAARRDNGQRPSGPSPRHMRPSRRSSAVQNPSPMFLWPCHISGMNEASGACSRSTAPIWSKSISPSPICKPSPSRPLASPKWRWAVCGPSCVNPFTKSKPK